LNKYIRYLFGSQATTSEKAKTSDLKTRYYKQPIDEVWEEVMVTIQKMPGFKIVHEVKSVGEIIVEKKTPFGRVMDITITVISVNPVQTAIDIYSASRGSLGDLGSNYRNIQTIFQQLDRKLVKSI
jgi:uncharacterized protein (DUF1499 family)